LVPSIVGCLVVPGPFTEETVLFLFSSSAFLNPPPDRLSAIFIKMSPRPAFLMDLNLSTADSLRSFFTSPPCSFFLQPQVTEPPFL
jgi:hypothetical protein